jgi:hypothetical protein
MTDNIITWNLANWVSVVLMALIGFLLLGALVSWAKKRGIGQNAATSSTATS